MVAVLEGEESILSMEQTQSMFLNCIPVMWEELESDVLAKNQSIVCNTLFCSAKFYPQPSHADVVLGICLYDCNFWLLGVKGDFMRVKYWDAFQTEIIFQMVYCNNKLSPDGIWLKEVHPL